MSIGIYAFLRIYFFLFWAVRFCSVSDTLPALQRPAAGTICPARPVWYRVQTGAACPASGRVCLCCAVRPGALRAGVSTGGVYSRRPAPPGQSRHHRKNKKGSKKSPPPPLPIPKILPKNKKTPTKGLCSVLYLPYKP